MFGTGVRQITDRYVGSVLLILTLHTGHAHDLPQPSCHPHITFCVMFHPYVGLVRLIERQLLQRICCAG
jgi:hypothetical protein